MGRTQLNINIDPDLLIALKKHAIMSGMTLSDFVSKTKAKTYGELWDHSAEMSERRAEQHGGKDPVKQEFFNRNSEERGGKKHIDDR